MPTSHFFFEQKQRDLLTPATVMQRDIAQTSPISLSALQNKVENPFFFSPGELGVVFIKSFFCAFLKKTGLDQSSVVQNRCSQFTCFLIDVLLVLAFSWLCASLFGYSFLFSLAMESTNHILRRTNNAHWIIASSPAFYAPGIILGWMNNANRTSDNHMVWRYMEHGFRSSVSGLGGLMGWLLANQLGPKKIDPKIYFKKLHQDCIEYMKRKPKEHAGDNELSPVFLG